MPQQGVSRELFRYVVVGIWNTAFGYACFALITYSLSRRYPEYGYLLGNVLAAFISITVTYLGYKWLVFKTHGSYLREWWRSFIVYGSSTAIGTALLPLVVYCIRHLTEARDSAPYVAGALVMGLSALYGFFGNKHFTFRARSDEQVLKHRVSPPAHD